jgi:hypothetical protein
MNGADNWIYLSSSAYLATASLTSVELFTTNSQNFITGSRFSLYGIKG